MRFRVWNPDIEKPHHIRQQNPTSKPKAQTRRERNQMTRPTAGVRQLNVLCYQGISFFSCVVAQSDYWLLWTVGLWEWRGNIVGNLTVPRGRTVGLSEFRPNSTSDFSHDGPSQNLLCGNDAALPSGIVVRLGRTLIRGINRVHYLLQNVNFKQDHH
jgi:hypothetical protein